MPIEITILVGVLGVAISIATFFGGKMTSSKTEGEKWGRLEEKLDHVIQDTRDTKASVKEDMADIRRSVGEDMNSMKHSFTSDVNDLKAALKSATNDRKESIARVHKRVDRVGRDFEDHMREHHDKTYRLTDEE